jgi:phospholipid/cholesterol/gamma-HCH transport system substrate-binding protein
MEGSGMKIRNELKAGVFVFGSLFLIAALILIMGRERQIFAKQSEYHAYFKDVKGLSVGAPVRLGGIPIGRVAEVAFDRTFRDYKVHVTLLINDKYLDQVKTDSTVMIDTQGLLGDRYVSLTPGSVDDSAPTGSRLPSAEISDFGQILQRAQAAVDNTSQITERLNKSLEGLSPDTFRDIASASRSIADIATAVKTENGFVHRLIYNEQDGKKLMNSVTSASQDIAGVIDEMRNGKGFLHALIYSDTGERTVSEMYDTAKNVSAASQNLALLLKEAREGTGLLHDLIYTPVEAGSVSRQIQEILASLAKAAENFKVTSDALAHGTGTLGALLVDPKLYDNLVEVTDGAKRSFLLRQAVRSSLNP